MKYLIFVTLACILTCIQAEVRKDASVYAVNPTGFILMRDEAKHDFTFAERQSLLTAHGWKLSRSNGSHHIFTSPCGMVVSLKKQPGKMEPAYVIEVRNAPNSQKE